jgi:hypothetical protein
VEYYNNTEGVEIKDVDSIDIWRDDVQPNYGSARIDKKLDLTNPRVGAGSSLPKHQNEKDR